MANNETRLGDILISLSLLLLLFLLYTRFQTTIFRSDSRWTIHLSLSMLHEHDTDLDEFREVLGEEDYQVYAVGDHLHSVYPIGTSVAVMPAIAFFDQLAVRYWQNDLYTLLKTPGNERYADIIELTLGSLITALTAVVVYWIGRTSLSSVRSLFLALIFALATPAWSTASRALWQHDLSMLLLALTLLLLLHARHRPFLVQFGGLLLAMAYIVRPTNSIPIIGFSCYVLYAYRRYFPPYMLWAGIVAMPFLFYNLATFGVLLQPYYLPSSNNAALDSFAVGLLGTLASPSRGLLVFSPILLFSVVGFIWKLRSRTMDGLDVTLGAIIMLHWIMLASWIVWWGGHAYGPRLFTDMTPFLIYFLIPVLACLAMPLPTARRARGHSRMNILVRTERPRHSVAADDVDASRERSAGFLSWHPDSGLLATLFGLTLAVSLAIHGHGAADPNTWYWNFGGSSVVADVNERPARLWDWSDPQFLRGLRPARPVVVPSTLWIGSTEQATRVTSLQFLLENHGDRPLLWEVSTSRAVNLAIEEEPDNFQHYVSRKPLAGLNLVPIRLKADLSELSTGEHSFGTIRLVTYDLRGEPIRKGSFVIPVSVEILAPRTGEVYSQYLPIVADGKRVVAESGFSLPPDITLNGRPQSEDGTVRAIFGEGWYAQESSDVDSWRWTESPAQLYLYSMYRQKVTVALEPVALFSGDLASPHGHTGWLLSAHDEGRHQTIMLETGRRADFTLSLHPGWNSINLVLDAGNFRPADAAPTSGDTRRLSFAVRTLDLRPLPATAGSDQFSSALPIRSP